MMLNGNILIQCSILIVLFQYSLSNKEAMTCGSTFKLVNQQSGDRLHSHDVKYGSGSGQQVRSSLCQNPFNRMFFSVCHRYTEC